MTEITFAIPTPPSLNKTRRIDWAGHKAHKSWRSDAGWSMVPAARKFGKIFGPFEIEVTVDNSVKFDLDSTPKAIIDACVAYGLVPDDAPKYMRKITIQWGDVSGGVAVVLRDFPA